MRELMEFKIMLGFLTVYGQNLVKEAAFLDVSPPFSFQENSGFFP